jgi:serine/threonine protein kinase/Tfp pilus assembly protein PilF
MKAEKYHQIEQLYHQALEREPHERTAFLEQACGDDLALRRELESLLGYDERAAHFIEAPPDDVAAAMLAGEQRQSMVGRTISHYQIVSLLGAGGMGEVYLAEDTRLKRRVALKLLPANFTADTNRLRRFEQEARAASALNHPNIITIHEIGEIEEVHYLLTEFIDGETLRQRLMKARLEISPALDVSLQVASALAAAHEAGIVHRDIKPENIMLRGDGLVKVLDFGLAKLTEAATPSVSEEASTAVMLSTEAGVVMGTAGYMSPEQARGQKVDARSDIFSLGVVLYEMITGHAPFDGATSSDVIAAILKIEPPPLGHYLPEAPGELERIVTKALRKDREERYQTIKDLLVDLKRLRQELEVRAKEPAIASAEVTEERQWWGAEYLVSKLRLHKRSGAAILVASFVAIAGFAYALLFAEDKKSIGSIAVLPFVNANADPGTEYLADGITESIINNLSQLPNLKVMSRNSVFRFKGQEIDAQDVGQKLGVRAVLTGRVAQRGDALAISIELVDARDNTQLWGQQYNRRLADVFAVQEKMAEEITEKLRLKLTGVERQQLAKRPTENLKAFQYYMQGRAYTQRRTREDLGKAVTYSERAIEEDRNYALAYAGLADAYAVLGSRGYIAPVEGRRKAEEAARKALALDDNLAEAHVAFGQTHFQFVPYSFSLSDRELRRAIELSPSFALAHLYLGVSFVEQGRLDEGLEELLKARELDPLSSIIARQAAIPYYLKRDYARALELLRQANELGPVFTSTWEIGAYIQNRLFDEALAELEKAKRERKSDPILIYGTGMVYAAQGKRAEALAIIKELEEMSDASLSQAHWIAKIYAALNESKMAFSWLEHGLAAGAIGYFYKDEPVWDTIRSDPRFNDVLLRMGIPS